MANITPVLSQATSYAAPEAANRPARKTVPDPLVSTSATAASTQLKPQSAPDQKSSHMQIEDTVQRLKDALKAPTASNLEFSIDDTTGQTVVKVVDSSTKEVIRQIPSEEMLAIAQTLASEGEGEKAGKGILLRNSA